MPGPLLLDEVDLVGAGLSLFDVELVELDRGFSPLADDEASDLFDRRVRLSGMISKLRRSSLPGPLQEAEGRNRDRQSGGRDF